MNFSTISISAAPYVPLSASYRFDDKVQLNPLRYQYDNGYSFFHHPYANGTKDVNFGNDSFFAITSASNLMSLINDVQNIDPSELVLFTGLKAANGLYITNNSNSLYATSSSLGSNEFFRIIRNDDSTYSITQNALYATVIVQNNDMSISMQEKIEEDTDNVQKFVIYIGEDEGFTIKTLFTVTEWVPYYNRPIERFWSFYDGDSTNKVKAIGLIRNNAYPLYENDYKFTATIDLQAFPIGYDGNVIWVKYYNELLNKFFNKDVTIKDFITEIKENYLIEYPYKTKIDVDSFDMSYKTGNMKINLINLKNIMTPEYDYNVKKE